MNATRDDRGAPDGALAGRRIVVTRARAQAGALSAAIRLAGGVPVEHPAIRIEPPPAWDAVDAARDEAARYGWVAFTSANAVAVWADRARDRGLTPLPEGQRVAAIGPATARALAATGTHVALVPPVNVAESLLACLVERGAAGESYLLPAAAGARPTLRDGLREAGAREVRPVALYRTVAEGADEDAYGALARGEVDAITFTSSSAVRSVAESAGGAGVAPLFGAVRVVCIGPVTAATARDLGIEVDAIATDHTTSGIVAALAALFGEGGAE